MAMSDATPPLFKRELDLQMQVGLLGTLAIAVSLLLKQAGFLSFPFAMGVPLFFMAILVARHRWESHRKRKFIQAIDEHDGYVCIQCGYPLPRSDLETKCAECGHAQIPEASRKQLLEIVQFWRPSSVKRR